MEPTDLCFTPATELASLIRQREVSPVEVATAVLDRIERLNPRLNALVLHDPEAVMAQARTAEATVMRGETDHRLLGVPVSVKDNIWTKGERTTSGSRLLADFVPDEDAPTVERLRAAGAVLVGKTNLPEFAWRGSTDNPLFGPSRNPWNLDRTPGGSTGGGAAAVAGGLGPLSLGSDGAGSIRIPASFCGLVGLKPTFGRVARYPAAGPLELLAHVCPLARTVPDVALMMDVIAGFDARDQFSLPADGIDYSAALAGPVAGLRAAWSDDLGFAGVESEVRDIARTAAGQLAQLGVELEESTPAMNDPHGTLRVLYGGAQAANHGGRPAEQKRQMDPGLVEVAEQYSSLTVGDYLAAVMARQGLVESLRRFFERFDLLLTPTLAVTAFPVEIVEPPSVAGRSTTMLGWSLGFPFNFSGQPAVSIPAGWTADGLPVGLQIVGRRFDDALVLRVAAALESVSPWSQRRPPLE